MRASQHVNLKTIEVHIPDSDVQENCVNLIWDWDVCLFSVCGLRDMEKEAGMLI